MINQIIILVLADYKTEKTSISTEILQKLSLSSILYLFYAVKLLKACNSISNRLSVSDFINNINLLTYSLFTKWNCCMLMRAYEKCLNWVRQYEALFNSKKYELIHLSHMLCRFNMQTTLQIEKAIMRLFTSVQILDVWVNSQLH